MKIVQSYWSKPSNKKTHLHLFDRAKGGWPDKKYNYMTWALSCLQFKKFYKKVELVTDELGYELLINKLKLPYTSVKVCLDDINHYHPDLWALGKIYTYSIQDEPFIHADGDIFINSAFGQEFESASLLCQNLEKDFILYRQLFENLERNFRYIPVDLKESYLKHNNNLVAINAGIIGGHDLVFFKKYTTEAFKFVNENIDRLDNIKVGLFNTMFEQALFHSLTEKENLDVSYYLKDVKQGFDGLCDPLLSAEKNSYIHAVATYKIKRNVGYLLADRLLADYPDYYFHILNSLKTNQI